MRKRWVLVVQYSYKGLCALGLWCRCVGSIQWEYLILYVEAYSCELCENANNSRPVSLLREGTTSLFLSLSRLGVLPPSGSSRPLPILILYVEEYSCELCQIANNSRAVRITTAGGYNIRRTKEHSHVYNNKNYLRKLPASALLVRWEMFPF